MVNLGSLGRAFPTRKIPHAILMFFLPSRAQVTSHGCRILNMPLVHRPAVLNRVPRPPKDATHCPLGGQQRRNKCILFLDRTFKITLQGPRSVSVTVKGATTQKRMRITGMGYHIQCTLKIVVEIFRFEPNNILSVLGLVYF